jgi:hypothetical protein
MRNPTVLEINRLIADVVYNDTRKIDLPLYYFDISKALCKIAEMGLDLQVMNKKTHYEAVISFHDYEWARSYKSTLVESVVSCLFHACYEIKGLSCAE